MFYELKDPTKAAPLFEGWQESMIWSCLQNVMGKVYADSPEHPVSAMALLADFCFFAGKPDAELVRCWSELCAANAAAGSAAQDTQPADTSKSLSSRFVIMVPQTCGWGELIESCYKEKAKKITRYAIKKEPDIFDRAKLQAAADTLPDGYTLKMMDENLYLQCRDISWCRDWVSNFADYAMYRRYGLGAVILKDGEPVSGASSYTSYKGGIEIQIDTREDCRRKGLAYACGARLILECLERGWYPSWDAQNRWSAALAEKLGYHFDQEYRAYEVKFIRKPVIAWDLDFTKVTPAERKALEEAEKDMMENGTVSHDSIDWG